MIEVARGIPSQGGKATSTGTTCPSHPRIRARPSRLVSSHGSSRAP